MMKFFSPSTGGFYLASIRADYEAAGTWPEDAREISAEEELVLRTPPAPTAEETASRAKTANLSALTLAMESAARAKGYDSMLSAISYAQQPIGAPFQAEGEAFLVWRSKVWESAFAVIAEVENGAKPMPTPAEAVAAMPALILP
ncbi:MAG: hypothetical protein ACRYF5_07430 [Janthinobacterium lividum]